MVSELASGPARPGDFTAPVLKHLCIACRQPLTGASARCHLHMHASGIVYTRVADYARATRLWHGEHKSDALCRFMHVHHELKLLLLAQVFVRKWVTMLTVLTAPTVLRAAQAWADATPDQFQTSPDLPEHPPPPPPLGAAGDAAASIAAVYTAADFQDAFHEGVRDIEIHAHLDLRTLPVPRNPLVEVPFGIPEFKIGFVGNPIRSIRVRV